MNRMWLVFCFLVSSHIFAETIVDKKLAELPKLNFPQKLTVGPDDNFQVDVSEDGSRMVYTRKSKLSSQLYLQSAGVSDEVLLLGETSDAKSAVFSPNGRKVAFVWYQKDSLGDLCLYDLGAKSTNCFGISGRVETPLWRDSENIVYVSRQLAPKDSQIVSLNISNSRAEIIAQGQVWAPAMDRSGRYLAFNQMVKNTPRLVIRQLKSGRDNVLGIDLPGVSSFPEFSPDGKWLYFSHYFSDSNRDQQIDANDNSLIYRVSLQQVLNQVKVVPQQMTSGERNCGFPKVRSLSLFMTCDFEGSLDIYQLPESGTVPQDWSIDNLLSSHRTARTYEGRILILNALLYKGHFRSGKVYSQKMLSNFILNNDTVAGEYYLDRILGEAEKEEKESLQALKVYLEATTRKNELIQKASKSSLRQQMLSFEKELAGNSSSTALLVKGMLASYKEDVGDAHLLLKKVKARSLKSYDHYLYFSLINYLFEKSQLKASMLFRYFKPMFESSNISKDSKLYYAYRLFKWVQEKVPVSERIQFINLMEPLMATDFGWKELIRAEVSVLELVQSKDSQSENKVYAELDKVMSETRNDYFLRRTLYVRALENLIAFDSTKYMTMVALNWLNYTSKSDTEFAYARQVYIDKALARAYHNFSSQKYFVAANGFFGSLRLTDDLESHFGFVKSMYLSGKSSDIENRYQGLVKSNFIDKNINYINALLSISASLPEFFASKSLGNKGLEEGLLDKSIEGMLKISGAYQSPTYQLLLGFLYLRKVEASKQAANFDQSALDLSHKHLMLAYDLGRDKKRLRASALSNLAFLHYHARNWGLSRRFFDLRFQLEFTNSEEKAAHLWSSSRVNFYLGDLRRSLQDINGMEKEYADSVMVQQRIGFLEMSDGNFIRAASYFEKVLGQANNIDHWNLIRIKLSYGYVLFKQISQLKKVPTSLKNKVLRVLEEVISDAESAKPAPASAYRAIELSPQRVHLLALGYRAQLLSDRYNSQLRLSDRPEAIKAQSEYTRVLLSLKDQLESVYIEQKDWRMRVVKSLLQEAELQLVSENLSAAQRLLVDSLAHTQDHLKDEKGAYSGDWVKALVAQSRLCIKVKNKEAALRLVNDIKLSTSSIERLPSDSLPLEVQKVSLEVMQWALRVKLLDEDLVKEKDLLLERIKNLKDRGGPQKKLEVIAKWLV